MKPHEALQKLASMGINTQLAEIKLSDDTITFFRHPTAIEYWVDESGNPISPITPMVWWRKTYYKEVISQQIYVAIKTDEAQITNEALKDLANYVKGAGLLCEGLDSYGE